MALSAFLLQLKGCPCLFWALGSLGRDLVNKKKMHSETCTAMAELALHGAGVKSVWGRAGQGRGCLGSTSQKGVPGTPCKIIMSVFGRSLPEKGRLILYVGDQKVLEILFIHVGFALVILKPCSCLMQVISLSLISGAGDRSWEKPVRKQYILLNYIHSFFFLMIFRLTVPPTPPTPSYFSGLEDFSRVN